MASIAGVAVSKVAELTFGVIKRGVVYIIYVDSNVQNLREQVGKLEDARGRVQHSVDEAERNAEEIEADVKKWLTIVDKILTENDREKLKEHQEKAKKKCFIGLCPNFKSRYQLSKKAETQANAVAQLLKEKDQFKRVSYRPALEGVSTRPFKAYEAFGSRSGALNWIMATLEDDSFNIIGVYGMGGVGKTTLVKEAARQARDHQLFDKVVFVAITQTPNKVNIQNEIAEKLDFKIDETSMDVRAARLRERLRKEKTVLIILDDIWVILDLEALGIPSKDEHKGCKILMTSRNVDVLKSMNSQQNRPIEILKEDEAWNLFKNMAGDIVERSELQSTAMKVAKKCAGLPVAILTVAKALKHKQNLFEWEDALRELNRPSESNFDGIPADAYSAIELSYKFLESEERQLLFLLCSLMGHNAAIEDLLRYGSGLGLFRGVNSMEETRKRVFTLVSNLKASCLLLEGSNPEQFDVHDVVRDVAIWIASRDRHWLALGRDDVFKLWPDEEKMKKCGLISLRDAKVSELLDHEFEFECPNLTFFSMGGEDCHSLKIPINFFKGMKRLKVLVFSKMHFSSLPSSIGSLKTLCTLCLLNCDLEDIVILGKLENLEILSLRRSRFAMLPKEIGQLSRLKLLDLSGCYNLTVISPNVLSNLSRLEELYLYGSFDRWEVEGHDNPRSNASLVELQHLSHLTTLEVHIPNEQAMPKDDFFFSKMERYKISIGMEWNYGDNWKETSRMLKLRMGKSIHLYNGVKTLSRKTESLYLDEVKDVMNMLSDPMTEGLPHLKHFHVSNVSDIKFVFDSKKLVSCKAFPKLESLALGNLENLEAICDGQLKAESFGQLKVIKVDKCKMLKSLFAFSVAKELRQLETIQVSSCENITELIVGKREEEIVEDEVIDILEFSKLRSLKLKNLPSFFGLYGSEKKLTSSQQRRVQSNATWLFDQKVLFPAMEELTFDSIGRCEKLWHYQLPATSFDVKILRSLELSECCNLKYVFTLAMVESFKQLKRLVVRRCGEMEEIIEGTLKGEEERISSSIKVFPQLDYLFLGNLSNLKRFCCGINPIEFPSLRELHILECPVLSTFHCDCLSFRKSSNNISMDHNLCTDVTQPSYLFNEKVALPMLEHLKIYSLENLERLWHNPLAEDSFAKLISIDLFGCHKLQNVFPLSMLTRLQRLKVLEILRCDLLEEIFESQQEGSNSCIQSLPPHLIPSNSDVITFEFLCLTSLTLRKLPKLKRFYHKMHITSWPSLKKMTVMECDKVEILFASQEPTGKSQHGIPMQQPLFWVNKLSYPNLHQLTLGWNAAMKEICHCYGQQQLLSDYFGNLKLLNLHWYSEQTILPSNLFPLLSLPNLETLDISYSGFKEIFQSEEGVGGEEKPAWVVLSRITELRLRGLHELMHLWKEKERFQNLRNLIVSYCPKLEVNLVPSTVSFQNLVTLEVTACHGIIKLVTHSTAKSLVQLRKMEISDCQRIEEIIEGEDDAQYEISFPQLNWLCLRSLPKLESFCSSGNYTFGFPSLETVIMKDCPKMKMFSQGQSNTPMLHEVRFDERGNGGETKSVGKATLIAPYKNYSKRWISYRKCNSVQDSRKFLKLIATPKDLPQVSQYCLQGIFRHHSF